jgi:hypothetical protein
MSEIAGDGPPPVTLTEEDMRELKEVIVEFLALNRYAYHKRVQKLVFASEIRAAQQTGHRVTNASFCPYHHGPYSKAVEEALGELFEEGRIKCEHRNKKRKYETDENGGEISPRKNFIVEQVWSDYVGVPTDDIVQDIKNTWLYEEFEDCEEIDFARYIDEIVRPPHDEGVPEEKNPITEDETKEVLRH